MDWLRGGINKCSLNVFWYKFYLKKEAKQRVDSFVHVFRNFSESNWKFSPVVRFGASLSLWCVNATIPVIVICEFLTKEYLSKISGVCQFSPFCVLYVVRYNKTNMTSLCGVQHTGMSYVYNSSHLDPGFNSEREWFASQCLHRPEVPYLHQGGL